MCKPTKHVCSAASLADAREIVLLSQKAKTVVAINENWSYHPLVWAVAEFVRNGGIGEVKKQKPFAYEIILDDLIGKNLDYQFHI